VIEYRLDDLGWEKFEQLVQALLKARLGLGIEAWGGHGDWGRDAYFNGTLPYPTTEGLAGGFVFQCKFVEGANAAGAKPERLILDAVRKECSRITANLDASVKWARAPICYSLFTNAILQPKTRRTVERLLSGALPASRLCVHDGGDVCQWLRLSPDVLDSFAQLKAPEDREAVKAVSQLAEKVDASPKQTIRAKLNLAQTLARQEENSEAVRELEEALALAEVAKLAEEEVEVLLALALVSSPRGGSGNRKSYLTRAEKKIETVDSGFVKVLYYRTKAGVCEDERDLHRAEEALRSALQCCEHGKDDEEKNLATQACVVRSQLIIHLCQQNRHAEATDLVSACDAHARAHPDHEDGELMQAAMSAGILWALKSNKENEAIIRIRELEAVATTEQQAGRIGGQLSNMANNASHMGFHQAALAAAEGAVRLGQKSDDKKGFLVGALYTVAVVTFHAGDHATAKRKAEALLDACQNPRDAIIRQAATHLIAEITRGTGDSQAAVDLVSHALASAVGRPEEVAFTKQALARALSDNGRTEEALGHAIDAYELMKGAGIPAVGLADVLLQIVSYSSVLGRQTEVSNALNALELLESDKHDVTEIKERAPKLAAMNATLRERIITLGTGDWQDPSMQGPALPSIEQANARAVQSLLGLWDEIPTTHVGTAATVYDFWGRGNLARILRNAQTFRTAFNITLEVRTLEGLKQAIRLWALYADLLLFLWKGPTQDGKLLDVLPDAIWNSPGGAGYIMSLAEKDSKGRHLYFCIGHASRLPDDVIAFLMTEARPLLAAGRVVVVPATGVGCVHPGHGPLEQLFAETANAIPGLRSSGTPNEVPIGLMPYSPDVHFDVLADIVQEQQSDLRRLRRLLVRRTRELKPNEADTMAQRELAMEIDDALRDLTAKQGKTARKHGLSSTEEPLRGTFSRFHRDASRLCPRDEPSPSPFAPLLTLQNFGYRWSVGSPGSQLQGRFEPGENTIIGPWLALPTERWNMLAVRKQKD
jgi:tetratricopeptide (TPR) repeat protein